MLDSPPRNLSRTGWDPFKCGASTYYDPLAICSCNCSGGKVRETQHAASCMPLDLVTREMEHMHNAVFVLRPTDDV